MGEGAGGKGRKEGRKRAQREAVGGTKRTVRGKNGFDILRSAHVREGELFRCSDCQVFGRVVGLRR